MAQTPTGHIRVDPLCSLGPELTKQTNKQNYKHNTISDTHITLFKNGSIYTLLIPQYYILFIYIYMNFVTPLHLLLARSIFTTSSLTVGPEKRFSIDI